MFDPSKLYLRFQKLNILFEAVPPAEEPFSPMEIVETGDGERTQLDIFLVGVVNCRNRQYNSASLKNSKDLAVW